VVEKNKRTRKRPLVVPLSPEIAALLRSITRANAPRVPLLGFAVKGTVQWYREFYAIQRAAGITEPYGFHEMRKGCNVAWNRLSSGSGEKFLGHMAKGVNQKHYDEAVVAMVAAAEKRIGNTLLVPGS
jgi:integrase